MEELQNLSIDQLANIQITSVLKAAEPLSDAPAAIYVIGHDDIVASGARRLPDMLRLAPNLQVAQLNATSFAVSARGFNAGDNASLSNKLLVLIDGRSVYSPLFGGVYWDTLEVSPENVDRIEVISGPGAALWGANAVNGVINIITRNSRDTQGGVLTLGGGNLESGGSLQYGGKLAPDLTYRVHVEGTQYNSFQRAGGQSAKDSWSTPQGGFRLDWAPPGDAVSVQGDIYSALEESNQYLKGRDLQASWRHQFENGSNLQFQTYYDESGRFTNGGGPGFLLDTYDAELQHTFNIGDSNKIVWGIGERAFSYRFENTVLQLVPSRQTLNLANIFAQDTISITNRVALTLGTKIEDEPYAGFQLMPSARIAWKVTDATLIWAAISRAERSPTPVDVNLREYAGPIDFLNGSSGFRPEKLTAYELGLRMQASPRLSFSVSTFYNVYDDLRTIEHADTASGLPLRFGNLMQGAVYGVEFWSTWRPVDRWLLAAGFNLLSEHLQFEAGSSQIGGLAFAADDPGAQAQVRSTLDLGHGVSWSADLRYAGSLPHPAVPAYAELDTRLGWAISDAVDLSVSGSNLLHARHMEFQEPGTTDYVPRGVFVELRYRF